MNGFELQLWANRMGARLKPDGIVGPKTRAALERLVKKHGNLRPNSDLLVAFEQLVMKQNGIAVGPIDGIAGPVTERAREKWAATDWRSILNQPLATDSRMPETLAQWPKQRDMERFFGAAGTNLVQIAVPFPLRLAWNLNQSVHRITVNKKIAGPTQAALEEIRDAYGARNICKLRIDVWGGCFNNRPMRGGARLSTHAYGAAHDWDPVNNALRATRKDASLSRPEYEKFWDAWTKQGFLSLGKARDFDWMHIQATADLS